MRDGLSVCPGGRPVTWAVPKIPAVRWCRASPSLGPSDHPDIWSRVSSVGNITGLMRGSFLLWHPLGWRTIWLVADDFTSFIWLQWCPWGLQTGTLVCLLFVIHTPLPMRFKLHKYLFLFKLLLDLLIFTAIDSRSISHFTQWVRTHYSRHLFGCQSGSSYDIITPHAGSRVRLLRPRWSFTRPCFLTRQDSPG